MMSCCTEVCRVERFGGGVGGAGGGVWGVGGAWGGMQRGPIGI